MDPRLSVVIPTYNRADVLRKCLAAFAAQTAAPGDFEIIVADDGSTDSTREVATREVAAAAGKEFAQYVYQPNAGANAARNRAIRMAKAPVVLLINDDTIPTPEMVARHIEMHERHPEEAVAVLGRVTAAPELPHSRIAALHLDLAFARLEAGALLDWHSFFTCNVSVKRSLIERGGWFDEGLRYHEDLELAERLDRIGLKVLYCPEALGYHDHLITEAEYFRVAEREALALVKWSRKAGHLLSELGALGFEPGMRGRARLKSRAFGLIVNKATWGFWTRAARACPEAWNRFALAVYSRVYHSIKAHHVRRYLKEC